MKAEDLMIGDYIQDLAGDLCQVIVIDRQVAQVETLTGVYQGDTTRYFHEAEGVLLTPEILENNGFEHEENIGYVYEDYNSSTKVIVDFWDNTIKIVHNYDIKFNYTYYNNIMVHRFQHILKDLEIEKEIVL